MTSASEEDQPKHRDYEQDLRYRSDLVHPSAWIAPNAIVRAHVTMDAKSSMWFGAVARGDSDTIVIGEETNVQDLCCLHADPGFPCVLGPRVTVGHAAVVHGAVVEEECLIGISATVLTGARIGKHSIIGAGALVREGQVIPERSLVVGVPAKVIREVTAEDIQRIQEGTAHYVKASQQYKLHT